jgi:nucleoside-diphosphate-sugar epimerase
MNLRVIVLCRSSSRVPVQWHGRVERVDCDDWTLKGLDHAIRARSFGCLQHLAAYGVHPADRDDGLMRRINVDLAADLVQLCQMHDACMVMAGSSAEYRQPVSRKPLTETSPLEDKKLYGASKATGALKACALAAKLGVRLSVLRLFNVYGPGEAPHRLLPHLVAGLRSGTRIPLSPGLQVRDFVYVDDVIEAFLSVSTHLQSNPSPAAAIFNVGTGVGHTVREFAELVARASGKGSELLGFGDRPMRADEMPWLVSDINRIRSAIGWTAQHDLVSGVNSAISIMAKTRGQTGGAQ